MITDFRRQMTETSTRMERLEQEYAQRKAVLARTTEQATARQGAENEQLRQAQAQAGQQNLARVAQRHQARRDRLQKALSGAQKRASQQIDQQDGRVVFGFQKGTLDAEKRRDAELLRTREAFTAMTAAIDQGNDAWVKSEALLRSRFGAFGLFRRWLGHQYPWPAPDTGPDENQLMQSVQAAGDTIATAAKQMERRFLPTVFRLMPLWLFCVLLATAWGIAVFGLPQFGRPGMDLKLASTSAAGILLFFLAVKWLAQHQVRPLAERGIRSLSNARYWLAASTTKAQARQQSETERIQTEFQTTTRQISEDWAQRRETTTRARATATQLLTLKFNRAKARHEQRHEIAITRATRKNQDTQAAAEQQIADATERARSTTREDAGLIEQDYTRKSGALAAEWRLASEPYVAFFTATAAQGNELAPNWNSDRWRDWTPPLRYADPPRIGTITLDIPALTGPVVFPRQLRLPGPDTFSLPLWLAYPEQGAVIIETTQAGSDEAGAALNNIAFRLLCQMPPGRLKLTVLDPVGLGQNFASLMHLADYAEAQGGTSQRIWTEANQIEERLAELTEHLEKVIQMYLRNEFTNLVEYNEHAGSTAEPHHLLLVTGFPVNFSESATRRLVNLIVNGGRCGILTLLHWDHRHPVPSGFVPDELRQAGVRIVRSGADFDLAPPLGPGVRLRLDPPPPAELATDLLHRIGRGSRDANKVEVPFSIVAPSGPAVWSESTMDEIRVPIGRTGASKLQYLSLGRGTRQHALISGKTGSGKSNLLHVIITNLALRCSPQEIEFYLVDFKKGVEFKAYATAQLPHARVIAIESDREFGLSVLERLDQELRRRGELFRQSGVQDVPGYRHAGGTETMPRCLLLVDEFQEYFVQEDRISQGAAVLLDRIVRQGRAFGIHVILASQTLGGTYALARATLGQMAVRIAFHCDEADAYLIMGDENPAPKLLSRPGEGIYNDAAGAREANSPFQAVWLPDDVRDQALAEIHRRSVQSGKTAALPVVFEGSAPSNLETNAELHRWLGSPRPDKVPESPSAWLGAPNSIKGPTAAVFTRNSGSNLIIVGQREDAALALLSAALVSLTAQFPVSAARFVVVDTTAPGSPRGEVFQQLLQAIPHAVERVMPGQLPTTLATLSGELSERMENGATDRPEVFVIFVGLQFCKKVKPDDSFGFSSDPADPSVQASAAFRTLYVEGPSNGMHVLASIDTYNNVNRFLGRKGLSEFEMRVLFQMSATDSASLTDLPIASQLPLYGAVYYNDREGRTETFRPYALPDGAWIQQFARQIRGNT